MKKRRFRFLLYFILLCMGVFLLMVFLPRSYNVPPIATRPGIQYWNLPAGSKIAYTFIPAQGIKKTAPIIFLQGGPGGFISEKTIDLFREFTNDGYDVYLYDQVGSGHSERLQDITQYTAERHKQDLEAIVARIGASKVILIGQSWGAILATIYAADHADKMEKLILTGPGPLIPVHTELADIKVPDSLDLKAPPFTNAEANKKANNVRTRTMALVAKTLGKKLASDQEADDFQTYLNNELNKSTVTDLSKAIKATGGGGYYAQLMTVHSFATTKDPRPKLKDCPFPLLIMRGQYDNQKWGYTTEYLSLFPDHQLIIIPGAGHSIALEQKVMYLKTVRDFLNR